MKGIMIQGTASDVGKSLITTAICRILAKEGYKVAPFKSQNMSNNSYVTMDGKEIGRAQGLQAEAAGTEATVWMNPILLKPRFEHQSEVVLLGRPFTTVSGNAYRDSFYQIGLETIETALKKLQEEYELIVIEGAGSPAEINLKDRELVNMKVAELADVPVVLVADIDRGGVFASIVGTLELLEEEERSRVKGVIINKFRGDPELFQDGIKWLEERTGIPVLGVLPYLDRHMIEGEDSLSLSDRFSKRRQKSIDIAVIKLPYLSNYSDIEPFLYEEDVSVRWVSDPERFGMPDAVIIPGTKSSIGDLRYLKDKGLAEAIKKYIGDGGTIVGICGGYQMLTRMLIDEAGSDTGKAGISEEGLGIIPGITFFYREKLTIRTKGTVHPDIGMGEIPVHGYEIHLGKTEIDPSVKRSPFLLLENGEEEGYCRDDGTIIGTYLHHLFHNDQWRSKWLNRLRKRKGLSVRKPVFIGELKDEKYEELAASIKPFLNWEKMKNIIFMGAGSE
ncbi:cobyric acid synthase CobQ [Bacillus methanolicus]|uniref:cobyric acid synthase n=1 Tax=Bacillus methanolicus TaxID=1471 RepID=UPI00200DA944|nr:cobyric acid synthase [Bacillus methanolicus]UQD50832.1 cobyric acid synthase CobQ [Bacillus methanolicus]